MLGNLVTLLHVAKARGRRSDFEFWSLQSTSLAALAKLAASRSEFLRVSGILWYWVTYFRVLWRRRYHFSLILLANSVRLKRGTIFITAYITLIMSLISRIIYFFNTDFMKSRLLITVCYCCFMTTNQSWSRIFPKFSFQKQNAQPTVCLVSLKPLLL